MQLQLNTFTAHAYPKRMYGGTGMERPISVIFDGDGGSLESLDLTPTEARQLAAFLLASVDDWEGA